MEKKKKLQLNRETIRNLSDESLDQVAGGKRKGETGFICVSQAKSCVAGCSVLCATAVISCKC